MLQGLYNPVPPSPTSQPALPDRLAQPYTTTLNLDKGTASRKNLLPLPPTESMDFPQIRRSLVGRKNRFGYCAVFDTPGHPTAVVKLNLQARERRFFFVVVAWLLRLGDRSLAPTQRV